MENREVIIQLKVSTDVEIKDLQNKENWMFIPYSEFKISDIKVATETKKVV